MSQPEDLDELVDRLVRAVDAVASGSGTLDDFDSAARAVRDRALATADDGAWETYATATAIIGVNLKRLREAAQWKQAPLAASMVEMGFSWSQVTVAQTEGGSRRRVSYEELFALAALFGVPVAEFLMPIAHAVEISPVVMLTAADARELVIGRSGRLGGAGARWAAARRACATVQERPAVALSRTSHEGEKK